MSPKEVTAYREWLGISKTSLAEWLGTSRQSVYNWETKGLKDGSYYHRELLLLEPDNEYAPFWHDGAYTHVIRNNETSELFKYSIIAGGVPEGYSIVYVSEIGACLASIYHELECYHGDQNKSINPEIHTAISAIGYGAGVSGEDSAPESAPDEGSRENKGTEGA